MGKFAQGEYLGLTESYRNLINRPSHQYKCNNLNSGVCSFCKRGLFGQVCMPGLWSTRLIFPCKHVFHANCLIKWASLVNHISRDDIGTLVIEKTILPRCVFETEKIWYIYGSCRFCDRGFDTWVTMSADEPYEDVEICLACEYQISVKGEHENVGRTLKRFGFDILENRVKVPRLKLRRLEDEHMESLVKFSYNEHKREKPLTLESMSAESQIFDTPEFALTKSDEEDIYEGLLETVPLAKGREKLALPYARQWMEELERMGGEREEWPSWSDVVNSVRIKAQEKQSVPGPSSTTRNAWPSNGGLNEIEANRKEEPIAGPSFTIPFARQRIAELEQQNKQLQRELDLRRDMSRRLKAERCRVGIRCRTQEAEISKLLHLQQYHASRSILFQGLYQEELARATALLRL